METSGSPMPSPVANPLCRLLTSSEAFWDSESKWREFCVWVSVHSFFLFFTVLLQFPLSHSHFPLCFSKTFLSPLHLHTLSLKGKLGELTVNKYWGIKGTILEQKICLGRVLLSMCFTKLCA
ncbi:hypothetical protein Csa_017099 [Cucumis sativus]|uniref:Uncharacterized protein n=1 Tax=Cucumis sativus TaxID=3659 RepID=A0A0A0K2N7_CUCSA|nr:hypothetical protein Csa_017099 [Cucumis sativus]